MSLFEELPTISDRHFFCCESCNGHCKPKQEEFKSVKDLYSIFLYLSDCCHAGVFVWDGDLDREVTNG